MKKSFFSQPTQADMPAADCFDTVFYGNKLTLASQHPTGELVDNFHRKLTYLRLSVTDFCNFRCEYCLPNGYQGKRPDNELTLDEIGTLLIGFAALGTTKVRLTGGEPSIRRDLTEIIKLAKATDGINTTCVTSNGYKLSKHIRAWHDAGLDKLNLSIDSFDRDKFHKITGYDGLPALLTDIDKLLESTDICLKINGILMANTAYDNLMAALDFVKNRPVTYRFIEFMQTSDNSQLFFAEHASSRHIKNYLDAHGWTATVRATDGGPAIEYAHPDYVGKIGLIEPYAPQFCDNCNRLRVSSLGQVHLCLFDSKNYDIRPYLGTGDVDGLIAALERLMPIKPEHHYLHSANSGMMRNLSMVGG
ncbi:GTP 3',8-cyclase MoaA [Moraxella marmotae]|uniref:GTP 3',8-cyclase MoaA n=1 Tax=Moraxella marmotae TaxID=3344520 RepID=UPI0035F4F83F